MNKPQSSTAQQSEQATKTQTKPKILKPDFSHRIPEHMQEATPLNLSDAVDQSALHWALSAVISELEFAIEAIDGREAAK